jgi:hypothetical protein
MSETRTGARTHAQISKTPPQLPKQLPLTLVTKTAEKALEVQPEIFLPVEPEIYSRMCSVKKWLT